MESACVYVPFGNDSAEHCASVQFTGNDDPDGGLPYNDTDAMFTATGHVIGRPNMFVVAVGRKSFVPPRHRAGKSHTDSPLVQHFVVMSESWLTQ